MKKATFLGTSAGTLAGILAGFGFLLGAISGAIAAEIPGYPMQKPSENTGQFQRIEQPLSNRIVVTLGGAGLMGLELWWFLFSKSKSQKAAAIDNIQEVTITVDGGYEPSRIVVQLGQPVRLKFDRKDPNSCLEEVRLPDFHIAQGLPLNQVTSVEFTPTEVGVYSFTCGMHMFRGEIQVETDQVGTESVVDDAIATDPLQFPSNLTPIEKLSKPENSRSILL